VARRAEEKPAVAREAGKPRRDDRLPVSQAPAECAARPARAREEQVRRAQENLALLQQRISDLEFEISGFLSLGYTPQQFTYQTTQLAYAREQIPVAQREVSRAQRAYDQFRDDARRQGVLPGWLR
jgi:hypothetical protein